MTKSNSVTSITSQCGWGSDFITFQRSKLSDVLECLIAFVNETSPSEKDSWRSTVPHLQKEVREIVQADSSSGSYTAILEYQLPLEARRVDALFLLHDVIAVIELKGKTRPSEADIDQVHAYARDLRCYHRTCQDRRVMPILVPTRMRGYSYEQRQVTICSPDKLDEYIERVDTRTQAAPLDLVHFFSGDAYRPLPSLIQAARALFNERKVPKLWQSLSNTDDAVDRIEDVVRECARTHTRRLILLTGVPGSGKTLVGLRLVHAEYLDDLAKGSSPASAIFLSGNAPLVSVLQYLLKDAGGGGKAFVRNVKDYVKTYIAASKRVPDHHVIVFDEAQRAYDLDMVSQKQNIPLENARSEPREFIDFAERLPEWAVVVGLVGTGQEIHKGEEAGLGQWADAIQQTSNPSRWVVHGPPEIRSHFDGITFSSDASLTLNSALRSHLALELDVFVDHIVSEEPKDEARLCEISAKLESDGFDLRLCRDLTVGKAYLKERYEDQPDKRYGLMTSSRDRFLRQAARHDHFDTSWCFKTSLVGPWYTDPEEDPRRISCRHLTQSITEFQAQGLELDGVLLGWGTDFLLDRGNWNISRMSRYQRRNGTTGIKNPIQLRRNAYRVLLTRARDVTVVYVPELSESLETADFLQGIGFRPL